MNPIHSLGPVSGASVPPINQTGLFNQTGPSAPPTSLRSDSLQEAEPLREAFQDFVGNTLFGSMLSSMRKTTGKPAYMHGGRAEEVFQQQMDQYLVQDLTDASASSLSDPMFELFNMQRQS